MAGSSNEAGSQELAVQPAPSSDEPPYTVFSGRMKHAIILMASLGAFFSPLAGNIYYPALNTLAEDLHVSSPSINFTLTSYMIFQGLAPTIFAAFSDTIGRRPCYLMCFTLFIGANIGLAVQHNLAALIVLRCLQSTGSSSTSAMASAVIADVSTSAERGSHIGYTLAGAFVGQSFGPVIGGILSQFLGWRSVFWFLTICAAAYLICYVIAVPETCRKIVGNGSVRPPKWNRGCYSWYQSLAPLPHTLNAQSQAAFKCVPLKFPNPLASIRVCLDKEAAAILLPSSLIFAGQAITASSLPSQFQEIYSFNDLQIGLSFIPSGIGSCCAAAVIGKAADYNYRRHCIRLGLPSSKRHHSATFEGFPIEAARLQIAVPLLCLASAFTIAYGWLLQASVTLAGPLVLLFFLAFASTGTFSVMTTLLIDIYPESPGTASAASNLVRCFLGAGASALALPMVNGIGRGWTFTVVSSVWLATAPLVLATVEFGPRWRKQKQIEAEKTSIQAEQTVKTAEDTVEQGVQEK